MLYLTRRFQKNKENTKGKDSNVSVSKNQELKWNVIKHRDQNENGQNTFKI